MLAASSRGSRRWRAASPHWQSLAPLATAPTARSTRVKKYLAVVVSLSPLSSANPSPPVEAGHAGIKFSRIEGVMNEVVTEGWHFRLVVVLSRQHHFFLQISFYYSGDVFSSGFRGSSTRIFTTSKSALASLSRPQVWSHQRKQRKTRGSIFSIHPWSLGRHQGLTDGQHQPPCALPPRPEQAGQDSPDTGPGV